ncbi:MAG TPA: prolyl oligopeptidase family serine peptidase [Streptosporangiaceae bacterium]|nr:prolyl oligopeptidase family serine peptidase [Streptosporangiaceae bacterium]
MSKPELPYGAWPSPITAADVARSGLRLSFVTTIGGDTWWQEGRPDEGGRTTVVCHAAGGRQTELLPAPWNARTRVHEYGGLSYLPVPRAASQAGKSPRGRSIVFANYADQRLYLAGPQVAEGREEPQPLTPDPLQVPSAAASGTLAASALRFADFVLGPGGTEIWCVQERHDEGRVTRSIVAVPLDGSAAADPGAIRTLVTGSDFFAFPSPSPDGSSLAWISWNHPHMPWDGTELRVAPVTGGVPGRSRLLKGSLRESVLAPLWRDNTSLYIATDWTGWWNIYQISLNGEPPQALFPADEEFAAPLWQLGGRPFALLGDGRLAVVHGRGGGRLGILDPETCELTDAGMALPEISHAISADGSTVAGIAGGPLQPQSVVRVDAATGKTDVLRREMDEVPDEEYLPVPRAVELEGPYGRVVHALVYPPASPDATAPAGELPPYVVWVHGGPTAHVTGTLDLEKAYFTSRGIGVIDVNYGGSTGYGRSYRERLRRQWGIVDVEDSMAAAQALAARGEADPKRLAIRGGSAGGWTALAAVTTGATARGPVFAAATSRYGVADLRGFVEQTHDFESRYLDGLIGPWPGFEAVYVERAPVGHVSEATSPVLLLQGLDDPVVPPAQSESIAADLASHGIRHAYISFEGESHGFRKAESIMASLEAELSFYGQILGFTPPGIPEVEVSD